MTGWVLLSYYVQAGADVSNSVSTRYPVDLIRAMGLEDRPGGTGRRYPLALGSRSPTTLLGIRGYPAQGLRSVQIGNEPWTASNLIAVARARVATEAASITGGRRGRVPPETMDALGLI